MTVDGRIHIRLPVLPLQANTPAWIDSWFRRQWGLYLARHEKGDLIHDLLDTCSISSDGCSYRLQIVKGRRYADGSEVTAEDVKASLGASRSWHPGNREAAPQLKLLSRYRLEIVLQKPVNGLLERLAEPDVWIRSAKDRGASAGLWAIKSRTDRNLELEINPHHPQAAASFYKRATLETLDSPVPDGPFYRIYPGTLDRLPQKSLEEYSWPLDSGFATFLYLKEDVPRPRLRSLFHQFARQRTPWLRTPLMEIFPRHAWSVELPLPDRESSGPSLSLCIQRPLEFLAPKLQDDLVAFASHSDLRLEFSDAPSAAHWIAIEENPGVDQDVLLRRALQTIRPHMKPDLQPLAKKIEAEADSARRLRLFKEFFQKWLQDPRVIPVFHIPLVVHSNCLLPTQGKDLCQLVDIGDRPHLQRSEDWRQYNLSALGASVQMLAHDLKKPFAMMDGLLRLLEKADDPARIQQLAKDYLPEVRQMTRSVQIMLSDILEVSVDRSVLTESISLGTILGETLPLLQRPTRPLRFAFDLQHRRMPEADLFKIARVFANITNNAIQASPEGATITFRSREADDGTIEISIHNEGSFIPPEKRERIFSAFYSEAKRQGTGLGLAIAQKIVLNHRGRIWCESSKDEGTSFHFTLPGAYQAEQIPDTLTETWNRWAAGATKVEAVEKGRYLILVEDDPIFRDIWKSSGVPIVSFDDPEAFLKQLQQQPELISQALALVTDGRFESSSTQGSDLLTMIVKEHPACPAYLCSHDEGRGPFARIHKDVDDIVAFARGLFARNP